jgi:hypothetical protein
VRTNPAGLINSQGSKVSDRCLRRTLAANRDEIDIWFHIIMILSGFANSCRLHYAVFFAASVLI